MRIHDMSMHTDGREHNLDESILLQRPWTESDERSRGHATHWVRKKVMGASEGQAPRPTRSI